jgi:hypothetical protein
LGELLDKERPSQQIVHGFITDRKWWPVHFLFIIRYRQ